MFWLVVLGGLARLSWCAVGGLIKWQGDITHLSRATNPAGRRVTSLMRSTTLLLWIARWTMQSVVPMVWCTTTSVSFRWRLVAVRRSYSLSHLDPAVNTLQYPLSSINPYRLYCQKFFSHVTDEWHVTDIVEVTHADETCTRNVHQIDRAAMRSIRCKFLIQVSWACVIPISHIVSSNLWERVVMSLSARLVGCQCCFSTQILFF